MKSVSRYLFTFCIIGAAASFLCHPQASIDGTIHGLKLCAHGILPSLFPFFVLSNLWITFFQTNSRIKLFPSLFHLSLPVFHAWILGVLAGYPVGAKTIAYFYKRKQLTQQEANHALLFCCNAGPAFAISILGNSVMHNSFIGLKLYLIHLAASLIIGILLRPEKNKKRILYSQTEITPTLSSAFVESCRHAISTTIMICGFLQFFCILIAHLKIHLPGISNSIWPILSGFLELTNGSFALIEAGLSQEITFIISAALLGWGGLCVHAQTISILPPELSRGYYIGGKLLHSLVSLALACMLISFPNSIPLICVFALLVLLTVKSSSGKTVVNQI